MANNRLKVVNFTFTMRNAPHSGPTSSDAWNDSFNEVSTDFSTILQEWNNRLVPAMNGLPYGNQDTTVDAFVNGIDGKNLWVDQDVESTDDDLTFFDTVKDRPVTVYESLLDIYEYINIQIAQARIDITDESVGLTTYQKNRIGANIFDAAIASASTSVDGKAERNRLNLVQLAADMYGPTYSFHNDGSVLLNNSVFAMVDALLALHNGNWDDDIVLDHLGAFTAVQTDVGPSLVINDSFVGGPVNTQEDLNQIRTVIKALKGTAAWSTSLVALYTGGAATIQALLSTTKGSGTKTATNPWGYYYTNVEGLVTRMTAVQTFTGMSSLTDGAPTYGGYIVHNSDSLETAIRDLDTALYNVSGLQATNIDRLNATQLYVGQDTSTDSTPTYTSVQIVSNDDSLETAIGKLDHYAANLTFSGLTDTVNSYTGHASKVLKVSDLEDGISVTTVLIQNNNIYVSGEIHSSGQIYTMSGLISNMDIEIPYSGYGLVLCSPDGTRFRLGIENDGALTTTSL